MTLRDGGPAVGSPPCQYCLVIDDDAILQSLRRVTVRRARDEYGQLDYWISDFRYSPGSLDIRITERSGRTVRIKVDLPSSGRLQPWLYAAPEDADDWVHQFTVWIDEEVLTDGLGESREHVESDGENYVVVVSYGWRRRDPASHAQLSAAAGADGWHGSIPNVGQPD